MLDRLSCRQWVSFRLLAHTRTAVDRSCILSRWFPSANDARGYGDDAARKLCKTTSVRTTWTRTASRLWWTTRWFPGRPSTGNGNAAWDALWYASWNASSGFHSGTSWWSQWTSASNQSRAYEDDGQRVEQVDSERKDAEFDGGGIAFVAGTHFDVDVVHCRQENIAKPGITSVSIPDYSVDRIASSCLVTPEVSA
jgi:hypothetical protein